MSHDKTVFLVCRIEMDKRFEHQNLIVDQTSRCTAAVSIIVVHFRTTWSFAREIHKTGFVIFRMEVDPRPGLPALRSAGQDHPSPRTDASPPSSRSSCTCTLQEVQPATGTMCCSI